MDIIVVLHNYPFITAHSMDHSRPHHLRGLLAHPVPPPDEHRLLGMVHVSELIWVWKDHAAVGMKQEWVQQDLQLPWEGVRSSR